MFDVHQCNTHEIWISTADKHFCSQWLSEREGERCFDRFNWDIYTVLFMFFLIQPSKRKRNLATLFIIKRTIKSIQDLNLRPNSSRTCGSAACCVRWTETGPQAESKLNPTFSLAIFFPVILLLTAHCSPCYPFIPSVRSFLLKPEANVEQH